MAFCSKCGTQINDGAKFCPKCGQPTSEVSNVQNQSAGYNYDSEPEEEQIKTWQKIVSVLCWPAGAILLIVALIKKQSELAKSALIYTAIGIVLCIGLNIALGGCSDNLGNYVEEVSEEYNEVESSDVEQAGYEDGYELGFQMGSLYDDGDASIPYATRYGAPTTAEEKRQFKNYQNAFMRGYREGKKAKQ